MNDKDDNDLHELAVAALNQTDNKDKSSLESACKESEMRDLINFDNESDIAFDKFATERLEQTKNNQKSIEVNNENLSSDKKSEAQADNTKDQSSPDFWDKPNQYLDDQVAKMKSINISNNVGSSVCPMNCAV